jgi:hypothetical protein
MDAERDLDRTDFVLMLHGETRHCSDCDAATIFLPVDEQGWVCTSCDAAVVLLDAAHSYVLTAA